MGHLAAYYAGETGHATAAGSLPLWVRLAAYPQLLALGAAGVLLSLLALLNVLERYRGPGAALYLGWLLVPLLLLCFLPKKTTIYAWYLAPAVALLAAGAVSRFPAWLKWAVIAGSVVLAATQNYNESPLEGLVNLRPFQTPDRLYMSRISIDEEEILDLAREGLDLAARCGPIDGRPFLLFNMPPAPSTLMPHYFAMLLLDQRPRYRILFQERRMYPPETIALEVKRDDRQHFPQETLHIYADTVAALRGQFEVVFETEDFRLYCRGPALRENRGD